ncbi:MAG TPA: DUF2752 domain-containing protein [Ktedonobacteraceae bacterium]|nr:DUF2752 domain-containing protein [Ktedonobacteraceae bacterium]
MGFHYEKHKRGGENTGRKPSGRVGLFLLLPLVFFLVPTSWLEGHRSICLIYNVFGVRCPGCGMTRALSCAVHGRFKQAFQYNRLVVVVLPLLGFLWLRGLWQVANNGNYGRRP